MKPKHYLPISIEGVKQGDFAMILGYPGGTDRYLTSFGVELALEQNNPSVVKIREVKLDILRTDMDSDPAIRIKYASKYSGTSNYWKYYIGQDQGLKRLKVADEKRAIEAEFSRWTSTGPTLEAMYGTVLGDMERAYEALRPYELFRVYTN
jgi:hypothetical protein